VGDRGNIVVKGYDNQQIFLYSHWGGTGLPGTLTRALVAGESRWNDEQYLARIIFAHMIEGTAVTDTTGFGIGATMGDNEHRFLVVNAVQQTVEVWSADWDGTPSDFGWDESHPISEWVRTHSADSHWGYGTDEDEIERVVTP